MSGSTLRSALFHLEVTDVLRDMLNPFILLFSETGEELVQHVHLILQRLLENKLHLKVQVPLNVRLLPGVCGAAGGSCDPAMVSAVAERPTPSSRMHLQCFLGFVNLYLCFI